MIDKVTAAFELYDALRSVGVPEERAKSAAEKLDAALENRLVREMAHLATREDLVKFESGLRQEITRGDSSLRQEMNAEFAKVREDMAKLESRLLRWNVGTIVAVAGLSIAIARLFA
jgi:hypothetical protein